MALSDWSTLPAELQPELDAIALHGSEEQFSALDNLTADEFIASIERITPAALALPVLDSESAAGGGPAANKK